MEPAIYETIKIGDYRYLRIPAELQSEKESLGEIAMIEANRIPFLLPVKAGKKDQERYLDYNISGLVSLKSLEAEGVNVYLYPIIQALANLADILYDYLLADENLLIDPEFIYIRKETREIFFPYLPEREKEIRLSLEKLMDYFIRLGSNLGEKEILLLYALYEKCREENVTFGVLKDFWIHQYGDIPLRENKKEVIDSDFEIAFNPDAGIYHSLGMDYLEDAGIAEEETEEPELEEEEFSESGIPEENSAEAICGEAPNASMKISFLREHGVLLAEILTAIVFFIIAIAVLFN